MKVLNFSQKRDKIGIISLASAPKLVPMLTLILHMLAQSGFLYDFVARAAARKHLALLDVMDIESVGYGLSLVPFSARGGIQQDHLVAELALGGLNKRRLLLLIKWCCFLCRLLDAVHVL